MKKGLFIDISVVVLTYNAKWSEIKKTLLSILYQIECNFEIIVSDDGSNYNFFREISELFENFNFHNYKLLNHPENVGTVNNLTDALSKCSSTIVKDIGQGDILYDSLVLKRFIEEMKNSKSDITFGKAICYKDGVNPIVLKRMYYNRRMFEKNSINYLLLDDLPHGASLCIKRDVFIQYCNLIKNRIVYCEDLSVGLMIADGLKVSNINTAVVYYECTKGISSKKSEKIKKDEEAFWMMLKNRFYDSKEISYRVLKKIMYQEKILNSKGIAYAFWRAREMFCFTGLFYYKLINLLNKIFEHEDKEVNDFFYKCI